MLISPKFLLSACCSLLLLNGCVLDKSFDSEGGAGGQGGGTGGTGNTGGSSKCGNGKKDLGETCDGAELSGQTCASQGFAGGILKCSADCIYDATSCLTCGDQIKNGGDICDGSDLDDKTCGDLVPGSAGGNLVCRADCSGYDLSRCAPPASCGNGKKDGAEACEGADLGTATCENSGFDGGVLACNANCTLNTAACFKCGDMVKNGTEGCDASDLGGADCQMLGKDGGILSCNADCTLDESGCFDCGDGVKNGQEQCDGSDLNNETCASLGNDGGTLTCNADCTQNKTACYKCGDGMVGGPEQCDGANLNNKTCVDFGFSLGTLTCSATCTINSTGCTNCGNGTLEAGETCDDGNMANGDGCSSACAIEQPNGCNLTAFTVVPNGSIDVAGTTVGGTGMSIDSTCASLASNKMEYAFKPTTNGFMTFTLLRPDTAFDSVLAVRTTCNSVTGERCADDTGTGGEVVSIEVTANTVYYAIVQGYLGGDQGAFKLHVDLSAGTCADPVPVLIYPGLAMKMYGSTEGDGNDTMASCGGSNAPDVTYLVQRSAAGPVVASVSGPYDKSIYAKNAGGNQCLGLEISCSENGGSGDETLPSFNFPNGNTQILVMADGHNNVSHFGAYTLTLTP